MRLLEITSELGQTVIKEVAQYTDVDINIMNLQGMIVSSTDNKRINTVHSGSLQVIKSGDALKIDDCNMERYPGSKPGMNLPIMHLGKITGVVGVSGQPKEVKQVSGLIRASVEIVLEQIYMQRQAHFKERQWGYWLQQLLHPNGYNEHELMEEATYTLGIETDVSWRVVLIKGEDIQNSLEAIRGEASEQKIPFLFILPFLDQSIVMAIPSAFQRIRAFIDQLSQRLGAPFQAGVGDSVFGLNGIRMSYFLAQQALDFANGGVLISFSEEWKVNRLIASIAEDEYRQICLQYEKALTDLGEAYLHTIDVYLANDFSVKATAANLHIHRNTLIYRLNRIEDKVGLDPRRFHDAFLLKIIRGREK